MKIITTLKNIVGEITTIYVGWKRKITKKIPKYLKEQSVFRYELANKECKKYGICKCGCNLKAKILSGELCPDKCYPEFVGEKEWEAIKNNGVIKGEKYIYKFKNFDNVNFVVDIFDKDNNFVKTIVININSNEIF